MDGKRAFVGLVTLVLVAGCGAPKTSEKATTEALSVGLPEEYRNLEMPEWSAQRIVAVELPTDSELELLIQNPFFDGSAWQGEMAEDRRTAMIQLLAGWESELRESTTGMGYEPDEVSGLFQKAVSAKLVKAQLMLAEGSAVEAAESVRQALTMAREGMETGPGLDGLNQTVPLLMSAEMAVFVGSQSELLTADRDLYLLDPMQAVDFKEAAKRKLREYVVTDVLPRVVNVGRTDNVASAAANLMGAGEAAETYLPFAEGALGKDGGSFDAQQCLEIAVEWIDQMVEALDSGWGSVESVLESREQMLTDTWGVNPFALGGLDSSSITAPKGTGRKMLPVLFAYEITQSAIPILESAMVAQISVDAAELTIMMADAADSGVRIQSVEGLAARFPKAADSLIDPLTGEPYLIDFESRTLRTGLTSVPDRRFLLAAVVDSGIGF